MTPTSRHRRQQQGAATLIVVMILFLVMALLAAYANRSLMFEQRISGSYYRASMAQEMAEGGLDWTVAMLNGTGIDASCQPVSTGGTRFVDKYLTVSAADRSMPRKSAATKVDVDCARTATEWVCRCPDAGVRTTQPALTAAGILIPSVGTKLDAATDKHVGSFTIDTYGCTDSSVDNCIVKGVESSSQRAAARAYQRVSVALIGAVPSSPASPLTVKGSLTTAGAGGLGLHNTDPASAGLLVVSGGGAPVLNDARMDTVPGTPSAMARIFDDAELAVLSDKKFFQTHMGMVPSRYENHPALRVVTCSADCGTDLLNAYKAGQRILWVKGAMSISSDVVIGAADDPPLIIVNGNVTLTGPMQLNGMLVALGNLNWTNTGGTTSLITGMVLVQGNMTATGNMDIYYLQSVANQLRNRVGSYARVSGGWIDGDLTTK